MFNKDQRRKTAINYFKEGYNCSQAVIATYADVIGIDFEKAMMLGSSFGGGMGRLREVCGAVSGMFTVIGLIKGYASPTDSEAKKEHYALIQYLAKQFSEKNGSIICRQLLSLNISGAEVPIPESRTEQYYKKRPCAELVGDAAEILAEYLSTNDL